MKTKPKTKKKAGRPPDPVQRVPISLRVTPDTKYRLDQLAAQSGRSLSQEAEMRLELTFERENLVMDSLEFFYGEQLASVLVLIGTIIWHTTLRSAAALDRDYLEDWLDEPYVF